MTGKAGFENHFVVTGGAGFIGSHMVDFLLDHYPTGAITCLDKISYASDFLLRNLKQAQRTAIFKFEKIDLAGDLEAVKSVFKRRMGAESSSVTIFNFAAESCVDRLFSDPVFFTRNNIMATQNVLEAVRILISEGSFCADRISIIHVSTDEVYGEQDVGAVASENASLHPSNPYAASKAACDLIVGAYVKSYHLPVTVVRANNIYGPRQYPEKLIATTLDLLRLSKPETGIDVSRRIVLHGKGQHKRRYLHVLDFVRAVDLILSYAIKTGESGEIYNIGTDEEWSNKDLVEMICQRYVNLVHGVDIRDFSMYYRYGQDRLYNDSRYSIDCSKVSSLGWKPEISVQDGVTEMIRVMAGSAGNK
ncbi:NAD(P)-binding protein [Metschnikowia bicuspidata var. bicuspidata NRRL YB-4993]|uniref:NAD(P)-binding protein n=1 Tax=Metschnikowia bicuspidata var. bicuspidata NRRL YB-4993 TaxID=869754 RepID=A0A1A0HGF9_9ASCO|nr:NAD(P)-binding protein [Metschnikowia bicuspidata var. bicuspidata NRRL YB-4993]OBA23091.1 NAD(P)-binding protein [Metschnikowia bicuspidata var. bicuspidata NRRL YB-4993]